MVYDSSGIGRVRRGSCLRIDNIQSHDSMTRLDTVHSSGHPFMDYVAQKYGSFLMNDLIFPLHPFEETMKRNIFTFSKEYMKNFVA